jgi:hypothetical protein
MAPGVELPVTYRSGHRKPVAVAGAAAAIVALLLAGFRDGSALSNGLIGFFGIGALVLFVLCLPQASYLRLTAAGLEFSNRFRRDFVRWSEVARFRVADLGGYSIVGWDYVAGHARSRALQPVASAIAGVDGALPETYGLAGEELVRLLNDLRARVA